MKDERLASEFPIDWDDDSYVSRREFFRFMTLASGGLAVGTSAVALVTSLPMKPEEHRPLKIASVDDVPPGSSVAFAYPGDKDVCILIRRRTGEFAAYSRRCTHLSCPVDFDPSAERLVCPCHNGAFAVEDGRVLQGPPPEPLPRIALEIRDGAVWAVGVRRGEGGRA
ncbi:MAG: Rieske 2Fe-2S domain-containing protein [Armatimonadetes bacterium]|nr:Rieske 2Fe-2S domain-containing protein [Armatimonadota bacterium]